MNTAMWHEDQSYVQARLSEFLAPLPPILLADVQLALRAPGKLLSLQNDEQAQKSWPLLTYYIAKHVKPEINVQLASQVAVAIEYLISALDLLDEIEDGDQSELMYVLGSSRMLNVASVLLTLARQLVSLTQGEGLSSNSVEAMVALLDDHLLRAMGGQHADLLSEQRTFASIHYEECIQIAREKSGSLMRLACLLGVLCAQGNEQWIDLYGELGEWLGTAYQIENDCLDLQRLLDLQYQQPLSDAASYLLKSDLVRRKKTLPLVLAFQALEDEYGEERLFRDHLTMHEGLMGAWSVYLLYRENALACFQQLSQIRAMPDALCTLLGWS